VNGFRVDPNAHVPPSVQIVAAVLDAVACGGFAVGDRLPSVRALAVDVLVNPNTVGKAYAELERLGVVAGRNGSGVYVTEAGPERAVELRSAATLAEFADAVRAALRAGHELGTLARVMDEVGVQGGGETR
jgi:GntR family transcriptional regulator